jgi:peptidoglycan L-alanyl-D-glutamate endopeptidase CwlK
MNNFKLLILSTDPSILSWKSLPKKLAFYDTALASGENSNFAPTEVKYINLVPKVVNNRIDHTWLAENNKPFFNQGYDIVALHTSMKQWKDWGIQGTLRGSNPIEINKEQENLYFSADENTLRYGLNRFEQVGGHETGHGYFQQTGLKDTVHDWHFPIGEHKDIKPLFATFDWNLYQPRRMELKKHKNLLETIVGLYKTIFALKAETGTNTPAITSLQPLVERQAANIIIEMKRLGHPVRLVQGYRSIEEQNKLYAQGRTTAGAIVTNAKGGESLHNYGCAIDFVFQKEGYNASSTLWELLGTVGEKQGFEWGSRWKAFTDKPHFQMTLKYSLSDFQKGLVDYNKFK